MKDPKEVDKEALNAKFLADIDQHTLDDLQDKASEATAKSLRSSRFADSWHIALLRLRAKAPEKSHLAQRLHARIAEAAVCRRKARQQVHLKQLGKKQNKPGSIGNRSQVAAIILQGYITAFPQMDKNERIDNAVSDAEAILGRMVINEEGGA